MNRVIFFLFLVGFSSISNSQSIGIGYGFSGTQNFGEPESTIHAAILVNINERVLSCISISNWSGRDHNLIYFSSNELYPNGNSYYGNVSLSISFLYKYYKAKDFEYYFGLGLSQFERIHKYFGSESNSFEPAISVTPLFIKYEVNDIFSLFANGILSFSTDYFNPNWGSLVVGIFVDPISMFK